MWLATHTQVYRFDGRQWTLFDLTNSPLHYCRRLFADALGNVWFVIRDGLARFDGQQWTVLTRQNSALPSFFIRTVFVDSHHRTWISADEGTVCFDSPQTTTHTDPKYPWGKLAFSNAAEDKDGNIWFALSGSGSKGLACYSARGEWSSYTLANSGLPNQTVADVACEPQTNVIWLSVYQVGLVRFDGNRWSLFTPANSAVPSTTISDLTFDANGTLWGATSIGLVQVRP
ncbi:ligand-binding sensor domain-containing protein [Hymenobacter chitinivorans]|uniref:Two component regulator with propeller domain n=1 Tax=Hymenobacter chitinivorans DSM 11115 TaxID=1121954 RepID=A0A2M9BSW6_9BACT|nr:hypothetical protein [Hymenobacter chitinivorans]PJJ61021.1 hypothetical protein CLV45_2458 [Hymenobacter chitinivorans DSM 11115]